MQLLLDESEEGKLKGLGLIPGKVKKLNFDLNNKIPNIGWRNIEILNSNSIIKKLGKNDKFYFVHSYFCNVTDDKNIVALSEHTVKFPAIIKKNKIFGCQFHPEKSNIYGMKILENFVNL
jgi:glutamine amidotransferase